MTKENENAVQNEQNPATKGKKRGVKKIVLGSILALFIVVSAAGIGFGMKAKDTFDKFRDHGPMGFIMGKLADELDLSAEQKTQVDKIRDEIKAKMDERKKDRENHMQEMEQMFRSDNFDKQKALDFAKQRDAERDEMRSFMIDEMAKFHSILTPEQRNKAADKMKEFRENKDKFFKDGPPHNRREGR